MGYIADELQSIVELNPAIVVYIGGFKTRRFIFLIVEEPQEVVRIQNVHLAILVDISTKKKWRRGGPRLKNFQEKQT